MRTRLLGAGVCMAAVVAVLSAYPSQARAAGATEIGVPPSCDRQCLYGFLDQYLTALKAKDPSRLPLTRKVRYTENNVEMPIGDGVWGTITGLGDYNLRTADPANGAVGCYGIIQETNAVSIFALRLKVTDSKIAEAEVLIRRSGGESGPFPNKPTLASNSVFEEIVPPAERSPRERMIALADGYFSTLQLNDGALFTQFYDDCDRWENGLLTTHNPDLAKTIPVASLGCAQQFKLGNYRYDDRVRDRRFFLVDEERGLVMAAGFIDHAGRLENFTLTDGTPIKSPMRTPSTLCLLELFKMRGGKIQKIEAVFIGVPYNMPSPWVEYSSK
ncbi:MAG TPA: hypothetical protein VMM16_09600 [Verrucomicrobiae bacterium]|nr:hypothetical protein [Verrucomicrobiae bacterium]